MADGTVFGTKQDLKLGKKEKLLQKALTNPKNLRFDELCTLLKQYGFEERENSSGHCVYKLNTKPKCTLTIQPKNGMAKPYQVKQFINHLEESGFLNGGEDNHE